MTNQSPSPISDRVALSQDLGEFLIEFSIALHRTSMYPNGHPSVERSAGTMVSRLAMLLLDRRSLSLGIAKRQLVIDGVATDPRQPVLRGLAEKLHRHQLGAIGFDRGANADEVVAMLRLVARDPDTTPLGLGDPDVLTQWQGVRLFPLTYEQLELLRQADEEDFEEADERGGASRSAQLWISLARAALGADAPEHPAESSDPAAVAQAINRNPGNQPYGREIAGYLAQLAEELKQDGGLGSSAVRRRLSRLIGALDDETLKRLVDLSGDLAQRRKFALDATEALAADAVVTIVQAAAASTNQTISDSMIRLLTKLSSYAEQGTQLLQMQADNALREQVQRLIENWALDDPNPDDYTRALSQLTRRGAVFAPTAPQHQPEAIRVVQMALEVDAMGPAYWRAVAELLEGNGVSELVGALSAAAPDNQAARALWQHLTTTDQARLLLQQDNVPFQALDLIFDRMDAAALAPVFIRVLTDSDSRSTRLGVFKRLAAMDFAIVEPYILRELEDERWFVRRNMLALLNEMGAYSQAVSPGHFARHGDPRVRREALLLWMRSPDERDHALCVALAEQDERSVRAGISEAQKGVPETAVPLIARRALENLPSDLRAQLLQLLKGQQHPLALDALLRNASAGRTWLGRYKLASRSPEALMALRILNENWSANSKVAALLARARKADDPEIRAAATPQVPAS